MDMAEIGANIRSCRTEKNMTMEDLGKAIGKPWYAATMLLTFASSSALFQSILCKNPSSVGFTSLGVYGRYGIGCEE